MAKVVVLIATGFEELGAVALIDVMRRGGIEVDIVTINNERLVCGANKIEIRTDLFLDQVEVDAYDMIVLPGGWGGTYALAQNHQVIALLQQFKLSKMIGAICAAPYVLKQAGVLGESYTCYPTAKDEINHNGYREDMQVVTDDNIMTSRGPGTATCFGLAIVEKLIGKETMEAIKDGMLLEHCNK